MTEESVLPGAVNNASGVQQDAETKVAPAADATANTDAVKAAEGATNTDGKTDGDGGNGDAKKDGGAQVPEKYDFVLPEGFELDAEIGSEFEAFAREEKLPQEKAQKFVDFGAKLVQKYQANVEESWASQRAAWRNEISADKEIGGAENLGYAARALDTFAPDLRELLDTSGWGDNPAFVRAFVRIGKAISEDRLVGGAQQNGLVDTTPEAVMYGKK